MNRYVDSRIAFSYPEDLRCTYHARSREYHLRRGSFHLFLVLPSKEAWQNMFLQAGLDWQAPRIRVEGGGPPPPTFERWLEEYARHRFEGRVVHGLTRNGFGEIIIKRVDLFLNRGSRRIWLRMNDDRDFSLDRLDPILGSLAFRGEDLYQTSEQQGPVEQRVPSPYVVSLKHFPKFGRRPKKGLARYDVEYQGDPPSDQQIQAVERFLHDEEALYEQARLAIFRYYNERIYPLVSSIGRQDELWPPCKTVEQVMRLVQLNSLMVHEPRDDGAIPIGLRFHCSWNEEDAMGLRVVGPNIEAVGTDSSVALDPSSIE